MGSRREPGPAADNYRKQESLVKQEN
jgi:hypothetical protein